MTSAATTNGHVIQTRALTKRYGELRAVDGVNLEVRAGDVYGFLGANGSGKTTTRAHAAGTGAPDRPAKRRCWGCRCQPPANSVLPRIGSLVESPAAYPHLSGTANLALLDATGSDRSRRRGTPHPDRLQRWSRLDSTPADRRPVRTYSQGMRQRLGLAAALMRRATLLILDEPSNGLDPHGIQEIRRLLLELNAEGTTIFLSSHLLAEIEQMCTRVGVLRRRAADLQEQLDTLLRPTGLVAVRTPDIDLCIGVARGTLWRRSTGDRLLVRAEDPARLNAYLVGEGIRVDEIGPVPPDSRAGRSRRGGASMIVVELIKMLRRPRTWLIIGMLVALPTLVAVLLADHRSWSATRHRSAVPFGRPQRRHTVPARRARSRATAAAADRRGRPRWRRHRRRKSDRHACATCWSGRSGVPTCCSPSW